MNHKTISIQELAPLIKEQVDEGKQVMLTISGNSMLPFMIDQETILTLEAIKRPLKRKDIVFYQNNHGQYLLHRILHAPKNNLIIRGDALQKKEVLARNQMIAMVTSFKQGNKVTNVGSFWYRFKVSIWLVLAPIRPLLMKIIRYQLTKKK